MNPQSTPPYPSVDPIVRFGQPVAALTPIRMFSGNDLFGFGYKNAGAR